MQSQNKNFGQAKPPKITVILTREAPIPWALPINHPSILSIMHSSMILPSIEAIFITFAEDNLILI